jgi:hypothetical protein
MANETSEGHIPEFATPKAKAKRATKKAPAKKATKTPVKKPRTTATERKGRAKAAAIAKAKNDQRKAIRAERAAKTTTTASTKATAAKKLSGLNAAAEVLAKSKEPLRAKEICERAIAMGWKTNGQTPEATLYAAMIREIAAKGKDSRFAKTDRGLFTANK